MAKLEIIDHDGKGGLVFEERPFVVMADRAYVQLGSYPSAGKGVELPREGRPALPTP